MCNMIIIVVLLLILGIEIYPGLSSPSDESGTQPDIDIEYENTLLHDLGILMNKSVF
jgi:hypothetical protein